MTTTLQALAFREKADAYREIEALATKIGDIELVRLARDRQAIYEDAAEEASMAVDDARRGVSSRLGRRGARGRFYD